MQGLDVWFDRLREKADARPVCIQCGRVAKTVKHPITGQMVEFRVQCKHEAEADTKEQATKERRAYYDAWGDRYGRLRLPRAFRGRGLDKLDMRDCSGRAVKAAGRYVDGFETYTHDGTRYQKDGFRAKGKGLVFVGDVGTGKTTVAYAIAAELDRQWFTTLAMTEDTIIKTIRAAQFEEAAQVAQACITCDLLVIDELGCRKQTENAIGEVFAIIHGRHERKNPTIVTTNLDNAALIHHYSRSLTMSGVGDDDAVTNVERMLSRLNEHSATIEFRGEDQRRTDNSWLEDGA